MSRKILVNPVGGFTLIELLIAMTVGLVVIGAAYQSFVTQQKTYRVQREVTEMLQNARAAVDFMARELRMATIINALDLTNCNSSITYISVLDTDPTHERKFAWDNSDSQHPKLQYTRGGSTQPLAENVSCLTIARGGNLFTITLTARTDTKDLNRHDYRSVTISADVRARCIPVPPSTACS
jgi:prepilin-type N-terminal cleavage/methylation domain-containing protein